MMTREDLPAHILAFIEAHIESVEQLKVLLMLHGEPLRVWHTDEITSELRSTASSINKRLSDLYAKNILTRVPNQKDCHQFSPATPEIQSLVTELAEQNQIRPQRLIEAIYAKKTKS